MGNIMEKLELTAQSMYCKKIEELTPAELHYSLGKAVMGEIAGNWEASKIKHDSERRAYYFSAEFLMGRMMYNNLYCLSLPKTKCVDVCCLTADNSHIVRNSLNCLALE